MIPFTVAELKRENPRYIVPCHCTGWKAAYEILNIMPEKFIQPGVGSIFLLLICKMSWLLKTYYGN